MASVDAIEQELLHGVRRGDVSPPRRDSLSSSASDDEDSKGDLVEDNDGIAPTLDHSSLGPRSGHNTGVKGVRNDARRHEDAQRAIRGDQIRSTNEQMERMALGKNRTWKEDEADRKREAAIGLKPGQALTHDSDEDGDDDDDDDDELREIRQRRLDTLKSQAASNEARRRKLAGEDGKGVGNGGGGGGGSFGHLREVGAEQYLHAIEGEDAGTYVVVHIYVKHVYACAQLTSALSSLARVHTNIKFIQVRAGSIGFGSGGKDDLDELEADEKAEEIVPTLLIYKGGHLMANLVRVDLEEKWGEGSERNIRNVLSLHGAPI